MKTLRSYEKNIAKIGLFCLIVAFTSCNTLRRVEDDELLLTKNNIYVNTEKVKSEDIRSLVLQEPNSSILGYPLRLNLYNLAKKDPDSSFQAWLYRKEKREKRLVNTLSQKQVNRLGESFLVKGYSDWLKKIGEPPSIIDTTVTKKSLERLSVYFNNTTSFEIDSTKKKKRAEINYLIALGKPFIVDSISRNISSKAIDSIYSLNEDKSFIENSKQFDLVDFNNERKRLSELFRNTGVYNFQESSIAYDILRDTARVNDDQKMNVKLNIGNLRISKIFQLKKKSIFFFL